MGNSPGTDKFLFRKVLGNGLRVLVHEMPYANSVTAEISIKAGSRYEPIPGISHFLEHMIYEGSKKYPSARDIYRVVKRFGGRTGATTSRERVTYNIKLPVESRIFAFEFLRDLLFNPLISPDAVARQKEIIIREKSEFIHDLGKYVNDLLFCHLWGENHPLGRSTVGTEQSISRISREDLVNFHRKFYTPSNMVLSVAGNITKEEAFQLSSTGFENLPSAKTQNEKTPLIFPNHRGILIEERKIQQSVIALGIVTDITFHDQNFPALSVLNSLIGNQIFFKFTHELGIAYTADFFPVTIFSDHSMLVLNCYVNPENTEKAFRLAVKNIKNAEINSQSLQEAKNGVKSSLFLQLADSDDYADFIGSQEVLYGAVKTPQQIKEAIDHVSLKDIRKLKREWISEEHSGAVILGPIKTSLQNKFNKILGLMS